MSHASLSGWMDIWMDGNISRRDLAKATIQFCCVCPPPLIFFGESRLSRLAEHRPTGRVQNLGIRTVCIRTVFILNSYIL